MNLFNTENKYDFDTDQYFKLFSLLYADESIAMAESESKLQSALDAVFPYCKEKCLTVNTKKTKIMIFSGDKVRKHCHFKFGDFKIDVVYEYV